MEIFYIGKTTSTLRRRLHSHMWCARQIGKKSKLYSYMNGLIKKNIEVECVELGRDYQDINQAERDAIRDMKLLYPNLKNDQPGGEGQPKGYKFKNRYVPPKGVQPECLKNNRPKVYKRTESTIKKQKETAARNKKTYIPVVCVNVSTKQELHFDSMKSAATHFGLPPSNISRKLKHFKHTPLKETWVIILKSDFNENTDFNIRRNNERSIKAVDCFGNEEHFKKIKDAYTKYGLDRKALYQALKNKTKLINKMWFYEDN